MAFNPFEKDFSLSPDRIDAVRNLVDGTISDNDNNTSFTETAPSSRPTTQGTNVPIRNDQREIADNRGEPGFGGGRTGIGQGNPEEPTIDGIVTTLPVDGGSRRGATGEVPSSPEDEAIRRRRERISQGQETLSDATRADAVTTNIEGGITGPERIETIADRPDLQAAGASRTSIDPSKSGESESVSSRPSQRVEEVITATAGETKKIDAAHGEVSKSLTDIAAIGVDPITGAQLTPEQIENAKVVQGHIDNAQLGEGSLAEAQTGTASTFAGDTPQAKVNTMLASTIVDKDIAQGVAAKVDAEGIPDLDDIDIMPVEAIAAVAELPEEALVTSQMNALLTGMEEGKTPTWALPAVEAIEAQLAERGLSASSVGRNALFAAIVSSALPLAQSNAQALQQRAAQNLQNQQETNTLNAQLGTQVNIAQGQVDAQLGIARFNNATDIAKTNAQLSQQMTLANMSEENQVKLANLQYENNASTQNLSAAQQTDLANLQAELQVGTLNANLANAMGVANLNAAQQTAIANAATNAKLDFTKLDMKQQAELSNSQWMQTSSVANMNAEQQSIIQEATLKATADLATADINAKNQIENAKNFLAMDMTNLNNEQQAVVLKSQQEQQRLLSNQSAENASRQFNASSENQMRQFMSNLNVQIETQNANRADAMGQFNISQENAVNAQNASNQVDVDKFNAQTVNNINQFNATQDFQRDQWNAANAQAVEQSNVSWRRQANLADTVAQNAINQFQLRV